MQKFDEMREFPHVIQAEFNEVFRNNYRLKGRWREDFFHNNNPIILELGCGKGEYSVGLARRFPEKNYIGIDIKGSRMHCGARMSFDEGIKNVGFIRTQIEFIDSFFAEGEIDEIWLTFPDPQMNRARRRLTSTRFLERYSKVLKTNGIIHLKTDSRFLYTYTLLLANTNGFKVIRTYDNIYNSGLDDEILNIRTYYEERFIAHNITIKYLSFEPVFSRPLTEPNEEIEWDNYHNAGRSVKLIDCKTGVPVLFRK